nr:MAG TPA: hypothetical protein [Caudoviricetes sp.]DAN85316.1 MAG TPA: hypothetical protein [Caudoviricetes sp.]
MISVLELFAAMLFTNPWQRRYGINCDLTFLSPFTATKLNHSEYCVLSHDNT